jgi:outer membrane protein
MKLLTKIALTAAALLCATTLSNAQPKFGYINSQEIIYNMPEINDVQLQLEKLQKDLEEQLNFIQVEYNNKLTEYQKNVANYSDAVRQSREQDLMGLQQRYEELGKAGAQDMQKKQGELMTPLIEKARATINKIAAEQNLTAVFDMAAGSLAYMDEAQMVDLAPAVKKELGIAENAQQPAPAAAK